MIAIPVDSAQPVIRSSRLFGNVELFAMYNSDEQQFFVVRNKGCGNGIETARFLKDQGATKVVYSHMGDGPFGELNKNGIDIYFIGKEPMNISAVVEGMEEFVKVDASNAKTYLDPGTASANCECGCSHG